MKLYRPGLSRLIVSRLALFGVVIAFAVSVMNMSSFLVKASPVTFSFGTGGDHGNHPDAPVSYTHLDVYKRQSPTRE